MMTEEFLPRETEDPIRTSFTDFREPLESISLRGLEDFDQDAAIEFSDGLNVIHSVSGNRKNRVIEWIYEHSERPFILDAPEEDLSTHIDDQPLSTAESVIMLTSIILMTTSRNSSVLIDDVLQLLDPENTVTFLRKLVDHKGQVILTANSYAIDRIREILGGKIVKYIDLAEYRAGKDSAPESY